MTGSATLGVGVRGTGSSFAGSVAAGAAGAFGGTSGSAGGQPIQVNIHMDSGEAQRFLQGETLRYNLRNSGNGLSVQAG